MAALFERLQPDQITMVLGAAAGAVVLVVFILAVAHYQLRALADHTALTRERQNADIAMQREQVQAQIALKQELVKRNLPPEELKLVLETLGVAFASEESGGGEDAATRVLKTLASCGNEVDAEEVEETVALVAAADPASLPVLAGTLEGGFASMGSGTLYAIARAYCKSHPRASAEPQRQGSVATA